MDENEKAYLFDQIVKAYQTYAWQQYESSTEEDANMYRLDFVVEVARILKGE